MIFKNGMMQGIFHGKAEFRTGSSVHDLESVFLVYLHMETLFNPLIHYIYLVKLKPL